jgi:hypothetical protein
MTQAVYIFKAIRVPITDATPSSTSIQTPHPEFATAAAEAPLEPNPMFACVLPHKVNTIAGRIA